MNEFVFALMFVTAVGLGPFAGMLALGIHTGGVLGKLLSETIESVDPGQVEGVSAVGAGRLQVIAFGVVPQVLPNFLSYVLLRLESDIRSASVIGMVGGGGIGLPLGHDPLVQGRRGGDGNPIDRGDGDVHRRRLRPRAAGGDLRRLLMRPFRIVLAAMLAVLAMVGAAGATDPSWPKEVTFGLLSTENAAEITRRWAPILAQLEKDLGVKVKAVTATDYRGTIEALKFEGEIGHLGPKAYVENLDEQLRERRADRPASSSRTGRSAIARA